MRITITGCGISGITAAVLLKRAGHRVEIFETRPQVGGNCHDRTAHGVTVHEYGPHLFHTNDREVWDFLGGFTEFSGYRHRVAADTRLGRIAIPYSRKTEAQLGRSLSDAEIRDLVIAQAHPSTPASSNASGSTSSASPSFHCKGGSHASFPLCVHPASVVSLSAPNRGFLQIFRPDCFRYFIPLHLNHH